MAKKGSAEFKISVIMDMRENHLSYRETVRKYWDTQSRAEVEDFIQKLHKYISYRNNERISPKRKGMSPVKYRTHPITI